MTTARLILLSFAACILRSSSGFVTINGGGDIVPSPAPQSSRHRGSQSNALGSIARGDYDDGRTKSTTTKSTSTASIDDINRTTTTPPPQYSIDSVSSSTSNVPLLPSHTLAGRVERALLSRFSNGGIERVLASWRYLDAGYDHREYVGDRQDPPVSEGDRRVSRCYQHAPSYVPGLRAKTWWDVNDPHGVLGGTSGGKWAKSLSGSYDAIRDEFVEVALNSDALVRGGGGNNVWAGALTSDAESYGEGWKTLVLLNRGQWDDANARLFPVTSRAIRTSGVPAVEAFFASMEPRSRIKPHSDFTNFVLTCHLPLIVPENGNNKCRLTVGDETRQWIEGRLALFDTSIYHDACNDSDSIRYILMMRVWHPDLSEMEREALQFVYDCLEVPELLSEDANIAAGAARRVASLREFPLGRDSLRNRDGGGFGGGRRRRAGRGGGGSTGDNDGGGFSTSKSRRKKGGGKGLTP
ncbi:hypothetical protein ACHAXA_010772 [Cyclostephanos tholiformis]|uniref:Aspartyl/asparaginy/proline hydroxylase domain-containing protein n=1 Tax=Cyclostephanos tholiformis TaxID=382380 RepID=A0ABD3R4Q1_9STRA